MTNGYLFNAYLQPLRWTEVDIYLASNPDAEITPNDVCRFIHSPENEHDINSIIGRYCEINEKDPGIPIAPADNDILLKLIWPLRYAKGSYIVGNYIGTIALCGMVSEMLAILVFEICGKEVSDEKTQKVISIDDFERYGQKTRVSVLLSNDIITTELKAHYDTIRTIRKKYLHYYSKEYSKIENDAVKAYEASVILIRNLVCEKIEHDQVIMDEKLIEYLKERGVVKP